MAYQTDDADSFAGTFRKEFPHAKRITSAATHLIGASPVGAEDGLLTEGAQLIREQVEAGQEQPVGLGGDVLPAPEVSVGRADAGADLKLVASELQRLVDVPEDWPQWSIARRALKRGFDVILSVAALLVLLPVFGLLVLAIRLESQGPALYRQKRCGRDGRSFEMLKFRSMVRDADELIVDLRQCNETDGLLFKVKNDPRVTRIGKLIRRYSIDELPQLLNVVIGDMSLVGPRPLPVDPGAFGPIDGKRHAVRPGLTCHWQVSGRSNLSYGEMIELDLAYIRESSIWTDIRLIARTVPVAFGGDGAY